MTHFIHSFRSLRRSPGFAFSAIATLALGIAANTAVFSVVDGILLKPLPYREPDRLVRLWEANAAQGIERGDVSPGTYVEWRTSSRRLEGVALYMSPRRWLLNVGGQPEEISGSQVTPGLFDVLGARPILGRTFLPERPGAPPADAPELILGYGLWQRRFGGDPNVVGKTVMHEGRSAITIIGVMPQGFDFPGGVEAWRQERFDRPLAPVQRLFRYFGSVGRLRAGTSLEEARGELAAISAALAVEHPKSNAGFGVQLASLTDATVGSVRPALLTLLVVVGFVLLIACANVANLMLARGSARRRETAVRIALGAGLRRLLAERFAETLILAAAGGAAGLALGFWGMRLLVALAPGDLPRVADVAFDGRVLAFTAAVAMLTAFATSILPAGQARTLDVLESLRASRASTPPATRARTWLVAGQVAMTLVLLVGSTLLLRSFVHLRNVDLGFDATRVVTADLRVPTGRFAVPRPWFKVGGHYERALGELASIPGVESVAGITGMPLTGEGSSGRFWIDDGSGVRPDTTKQFTAKISIVTPEYFATMGIPVLRGRSFTAADRLSETALMDPAEAKLRPRGVVVINQALADRFWPRPAEGGHDGKQDPIGQAIRLFDHWAVSSSTVVGVVRDLRTQEVTATEPPAIYVPWGEMPGFRLSVAARLRAGDESVLPVVRSRLEAFDSQLLVSSLRPMHAVVSGAVSGPRFNLVLVSSFALLALALAAVGIYGVVGYLVVQRTREMGVRLALGATPRDVLTLVMKEGLTPVAIGAAAGLLLAAASGRVLRTLLFGVPAFDPASFVAAASLLMAVAAAAALVSASRVTAMDPLVALREE
jgi:putative ABC transport system permease protein